MEENASNALMMAGSVLIGLIVLTAFIGLFSSFTNSSMKIEARLAESQIKEFNAKYENLATSNEDNGDTTSWVTIYDIISLINFTKQYNHDVYTEDECEHYNQGSMPYYVQVFIDFGALRTKYDSIKSVTSAGSNPYQEVDNDKLNLLLRNCYYGGRDDIEWAEREDYIYKFICTDIHYNSITGQVDRISFKFEKEDWF